jgi:hypothetical protein
MADREAWGFPSNQETAISRTVRLVISFPPAANTSPEDGRITGSAEEETACNLQKIGVLDLVAKIILPANTVL